MAIALTGARVWDGESDAPSARPLTVRIEGDRIEAIGSDADLTADARGIHLENATLLPGLIDCHVHMELDPAIGPPRDQLAVPDERRRVVMRRRAEAMVRAGITTARDLGGGRGLELELRDHIHAGECPGPRLLCAGQPITSPGGHCHFWGGEARGRLGVEAVIRRNLARGCDWIKVMATGGVLTRGKGITEVQLSLDELSHAVRTAGAAGRSVAAHCHGTAGIGLASQAGVRTVEHCSFAGAEGFGSDFDPAVVDALARRGPVDPLWVSPTVNSGWGRRRGGADGPTPFWRRMGRVLAALREAGVGLVASTDAGIPGVLHHRLPEALPVFAELAGLSPVEVLRSATSEAARALGLGRETGRVAPGFAADLVAVAGDPLADLGALGRPRLVVARGQVVADGSVERA